MGARRPDARAPVYAPVRVAALIDTAQVSGPGRQLAAAARALAGRGVEVRVFLLQRAGAARPPYADYLAAEGVAHEVLAERGALDAGVVGRLRAALAAWRPDVVQTHSYKMTAAAWLLRHTGARWPWVAFFHGHTAEDLKVRVYHAVDRALLPRADRLVLMAEAHRARFAHARDAARVRVVHNAVVALPNAGPGVAPPDLAPVRAAARARQGADVPLVGVVGRLSREKGVDVFLDACRLLRDRGVRFAAVVAGDGPDRAALEARRRELGLADDVTFLGHVAAVQGLYPQLDLVVLPSRSEGLPNVLLEALRADVPAVATRVGAVPEVLDGWEEAGVTVPPGDAAALADGIIRGLALAGAPGARAARAAVAARFSLARRVETLRALYDEVLAEAGRAARRAA